MRTGITAKILKKFIYIFMGVYSFISLYPLIWMVFYSLKDNEEIFVTNPFLFPKVPRWSNYIRALTEFNVFTYLKNSVIVSIVSIAVGIVLVSMFSYAIARMNFRLASAARTYIVLGMFIPVQIIIIPLVLIVRDFHLTDTLGSLIVPYIALSFPFATIVLYGFYRNIPFDMEESACIDGANIYIIFWKIILPLMKPAVATLIIFQFMSHWNEFTLALILISNENLKTLPLGLVHFVGQFSTEWGPIGASLVIASFPVILVYLVFSDKVENAMSIGSALKG